MTVPFTRHKERALDEEAKVPAVLERRPVALAHKEADKTTARVVQLVALLVERDSGRVHDREVGGEGPVEREETVIQNFALLSHRRSLACRLLAFEKEEKQRVVALRVVTFKTGDGRVGEAVRSAITTRPNVI